jgi:hypothetical protein
VREQESSPYVDYYVKHEGKLMINDILSQGEVDNVIECQSKCVMTTNPIDSSYVANCRAISYRHPAHDGPGWCRLHSKLGHMQDHVGNWNKDEHAPIREWDVYVRTDVDPPPGFVPDPVPEPQFTSYSEIPREVPEIIGASHFPNRLDPDNSCGKSSFGAAQRCIENFHFYGMFPGTCSIGYLESHKAVESAEACAELCFDNWYFTQKPQCGFFSYSSNEKNCALYTNEGCGAGYQDNKIFYFSYAIARQNVPFEEQGRVV